MALLTLKEAHQLPDDTIVIAVLIGADGQTNSSPPMLVVGTFVYEDGTVGALQLRPLWLFMDGMRIMVRDDAAHDSFVTLPTDQNLERRHYSVVALPEQITWVEGSPGVRHGAVSYSSCAS